jgi:hypothetical protein
MNPWPFVTAVYVVTFAAATGLALWSWLEMRRAERK